MNIYPSCFLFIEQKLMFSMSLGDMKLIFIHGCNKNTFLSFSPTLFGNFFDLEKEGVQQG